MLADVSSGKTKGGQLIHNPLTILADNSMKGHIPNPSLCNTRHKSLIMHTETYIKQCKCLVQAFATHLLVVPGSYHAMAIVSQLGGLVKVIDVDRADDVDTMMLVFIPDCLHS